MVDNNPFMPAFPRPAAEPRARRAFAGTGPTPGERVGGAFQSVLSLGTAPPEFPQAQERKRRVGEQLILQRVQELQNQGLSPSQMVNAVIGSEEFAVAISEIPSEEVFDFVTKTVQAISPPPLQRIAVPAGTKNIGVDEGGRVAPGTEVSQPTGDEQLVNAIIAAQDRGDKRAADLLKRRLGSTSGGEIPASVKLQLRAAGVTTDDPRFDSITPEKATSALTVGKSDSSSLPMNALVARALGMDTESNAVNAYTPEEAQAILETRQELTGSENFLKMLFESMQGGDGKVSGLPEGRRSIEQRREELRSSKRGNAPRDFGDMDTEALRKLSEDVIAGKVTLPSDEIEKLAAELKKRGE